MLTPAGFLHEYASADPATQGGMVPLFSLFLPMCTLGPPAGTGARSHKFHIEERKDGLGTTKAGGGGLGGLLKGGAKGGGGGGHAWSFRARSREEMMEWWNDLRMLCARFLVASEQMERSGPIAAAVRSAGYLSESENEDEEEEEEDGEGSSVEEEVDEGGGDHESYEDAHTEPPEYVHPDGGYPVSSFPSSIVANTNNV